MTPSVPFAALSDLLKRFDGWDHRYAPENFLAHLNARVGFQLGPQPRYIKPYDMALHTSSFFYSLLTGTASQAFTTSSHIFL